MLLSIETSCDETSVAIFDLELFFRESAISGASGETSYLKAELIASQTKLHEPFGGVVPELAAREHVKNLPLLIKEALRLAKIGVADLTAVAVTCGPGLKGCLMVGVCYAKAFALSRGIPLIPVNHLEGHLFAGELMDRATRPQYPYLALLVSGGHTQLVMCREFKRSEIIAETRDDAAGEAFDKIATLLGLPYPGGPALSKLAESGDSKKFKFPLAVRDDQSSFSFSGLKTAVNRTTVELGDRMSDAQLRADLAASAQAAIVSALVEKTVKGLRAHRVKSLLLTGGVAANQLLRSRLQHESTMLGVRFSAPPHRWCTDNAAMIGIVAAKDLQLHQDAMTKWRNSGRNSQPLGPFADLGLGADPSLPIGSFS